MIKLALAVSASFYRDTIRKYLEQETDIRIVSEASNQSEILFLLEQRKAEILFIDSAIPRLDIVEILHDMKEKTTNLKVIMLFHSLSDDTVIDSICLGINGFLQADSNSEEFIHAIKAVNNDEIWADVKLISKALKKLLQSKRGNLKQITQKLTKREEEIAQLILQGYSNKEIAKNLYISEKTVKTHLAHIFKKLGIKSRFQLSINMLESDFFRPSLKTK